MYAYLSQTPVPDDSPQEGLAYLAVPRFVGVTIAFHSMSLVLTGPRCAAALC